MAKKKRKACVLKQGVLSIPEGSTSFLTISKNGVLKMSKDSYLIRKKDRKGGFIV